jgi:Fe2+ or Zn2+ uptake regulation protein
MGWSGRRKEEEERQMPGQASTEERGKGEATNDPRRLCADIIREHGLKATPQRIRILRFLRERDDHPDVETIYMEVRKRTPSLSRTTVYNTMELFREKGVVSVLTISREQQHYEFGQDLHHHLLCEDCGRIYDIDVGCPHLGKMLHGEHKIKEVHGYFRGTCKHCLAASAEEEVKEES